MLSERRTQQYKKKCKLFCLLRVTPGWFMRHCHINTRYFTLPNCCNKVQIICMYIRERCYRVPTTEDCTQNVLRLLLSVSSCNKQFQLVLETLSQQQQYHSMNCYCCISQQNDQVIPHVIKIWITKSLLPDIAVLFKQLSVFGLVLNKMLPDVK